VSGALVDHAGELRCLVKTDPDPRVRRRAQALLQVAQGDAVVRVATAFGTAAHRVRTWRDRFLDRGREGLVDKPRAGRPPKLDPAQLALLDEALTQGPQAYGWPVTMGSIRDLCALVGQQCGVQVSVSTVPRVVPRLGYRYRRPRHDLRHRQDREAVASAKEVLAWLGTALSPVDCTSSMATNARSIGTLGWQRCGSDAGNP
jgi:transposase